MWRAYQILALFILLGGGVGAVEAVEVRGLRIWTSPESTRLVFDTSGNAKYAVYTETGPDRVVIDLERAHVARPLPESNGDDPLIRAIRSEKRNRKDLRVTVDLRSGVRAKSFRLQPNREYGHRLVVDLFPVQSEAEEIARVVKDLTTPPVRGRDVVVAIDAGHGGEDPGAKGANGSYEKNVTLSIARKLASQVARAPGMKPVLIRDGDYYIGLRQRIEKARKAGADLFVSIHADAFRDPSARGSSVYTLSHRGASSEAARWLADRENAADLIGGVSLEDKDDVLASVLLDLSQSATLQASTDVAQEVLDELSDLGKVHKRKVQRAGFVVLKAPDIPSVLVETAFISNPGEEKKLTDPSHQLRLARALMEGIQGYFERYAPPGTLLAERRQQQHVIARGDTLTGIARQYRVSLSTLRRANDLPDDTIRIGQVLRIPEG